MLINLFSFRSLGRLLYVLLLDMDLEGGDLFVDSSNILLNYVCELLSLWSLLDKSPVKVSSAYANFHGAIVEQGLPLSDLGYVSRRKQERAALLTLSQLSKADSGGVDVLGDDRG